MRMGWLGQAVTQATIENLNVGAASYPTWCEWMPFSSWFDACKPAKPSQVLQERLSNLGPAADPAIVTELEQMWAATDQQQCDSHPEECAAYQFALAHPNLSAAIGTGAAAQTVAQAATVLSSSWILSALLIGGVVLFVVSQKR